MQKEDAGYKTQLMIADWQEGNPVNIRTFDIKYFTNKYGFKIIKVVIVAHGSQHNDTIATVELKAQHG